MTKVKKNIEKSDRGIFRVFEFITEVIGWLQVVASPLLIGIFVGAIIYFTGPTTTRLVIGIAIAAVGLIIGIIWATKQWKSKGTISFMSRIMATPELDKPDEENIVTTTKKTTNRKATANSTFAIGGVSCSVDTFVLKIPLIANLQTVQP